MGEDEPIDPLPDLIATIDQLVAMVPHMARAAKGVYDAYIAEGFSEEQTMLIVLEYVRKWNG